MTPISEVTAECKIINDEVALAGKITPRVTVGGHALLIYTLGNFGSEAKERNSQGSLGQVI